MNTLEILGISKTYSNGFCALKDVSLKLSDGVTGLVGANGSGKTTMMDIICTILHPTTGKVLWNGVDIAQNPNALRKELGYLPQETPLYPDLNAEDFLYYVGTIKGIPSSELKQKIEHALGIVNLVDVKKRKAGTYSGGMKRRLGIAQSLLNDPKIIIVDEPTVGLDPAERTNFKNLLAKIASNKIVLISSHIIPDIEAIARNIIFLKAGEVVTFGSDHEIVSSLVGKVWSLVCEAAKLQDYINKYTVTDSKLTDLGVALRIVALEKPAIQARSEKPTLEDAYYYYIVGQTRHDTN